MHRHTLPPRANLAQLKHQAKDVRSGARVGDGEALATLRQLHRFAGWDDRAIAAAEISLSEAQYALALDYGFESWAALKRHVEAMGRSSEGKTRAAVVREGEEVVVDGLQSARWGGGTRRQNSVMAALALVSEALGDEVDYDFLMGRSGAAFRVQMALDQLCPSSPHASCGFNCRDAALAAWGRAARWIETDDKHAQNRAAAREAIIESVDRGVPALHDHMECSLIVGYRGEELLVRRYTARNDGYEVMREWPWKVGIVGAQREGEVEGEGEAIVRSLRLGVELFDTPASSGYASGRNAYARWGELLMDETALAGKKADELFAPALGHAFSMDCLLDARGAASNYLLTCAESLGEAEAGRVRRAAAIYDELERVLRQRRRELAPYPWEMKGMEEWTVELRGRAAEFLQEVERLDARAVDEIREVVR